MIAITAGGIAGTVCFVGLTLLLHRRLTDARIRQTSTYMDLAVLIILWVQLSIGLITLPYSLGHHDASVMLTLSHWGAGHPDGAAVDAKTLQGLDWPYLIHLVLGMTIFLIFPFSRLVHIWSAPVWYLGRKGYRWCAHAPRWMARALPVPRRRRSERHERGPPRLRLHGQTVIAAKPRTISVNGVEISRAAIARETQNHPASKPIEAWQARQRARSWCGNCYCRRHAASPSNHNRSATRMGDAKPRRRRWCAASSHAKL